MDSGGSFKGGNVRERYIPQKDFDAVEKQRRELERKNKKRFTVESRSNDIVRSAGWDSRRPGTRIPMVRLSKDLSATHDEFEDEFVKSYSPQVNAMTICPMKKI